MSRARTNIAGAVVAVVATWGGLDVLIGVAGIEPWLKGHGRAYELPLENWQRIIDTNFTGMFLTCKHGVRAMFSSGGGSVIITGLPTGIYGGALDEDAYSASKAGCHGLVRIMANEYARDGIRVNCVVPGFIDTAVNAAAFEDPVGIATYCANIPMRRPGHPDELAGIYAWLASDDAVVHHRGLLHRLWWSDRRVIREVHGFPPLETPFFPPGPRGKEAGPLIRPFHPRCPL